MRSFAATIRRFSWLALVGLPAVLLLGCGGSVPTGTVKGRVTLDDAPFSNASIAFICHETGQADSVDINSDGTFEIAAPLQVGSYVAFLAPRAMVEVEGKEGPVSMTGDSTVPEKYWDESASDIKVEIVEGDNDVTVALKTS